MTSFKMLFFFLRQKVYWKDVLIFHQSFYCRKGRCETLTEGKAVVLKN